MPQASMFRYFDKNLATCPHESEIVKSLWRVACITVLMLFAAIGGLFICEEAQAGTTITGDIVTDTIWSPTGSPYWIEADITVETGAKLTIQAGTEVRFDDYYHLWVDGTILVEGNATDPVIFTSNRTTPAPEDWVGLLILGEAHINFANVSYSHTGICIASSHNTVNESSFYRNADSLVISGGSQNLIRNNSVLESANRGILMFSSTWNNVTGNNVTRSWNIGIFLVAATNDTVSHNTLYRNFMNGMEIELSSHNWISSNTVLESQWDHGIYVLRSQDNRISNNTLRRNNNGIHLELSSGNNISGNEISKSSIYHGISLYSSDSNAMTENHIHNVSSDGIYLESAQGNSMHENNIHDNGQGIYVYDCFMSEIAENRIVGNAWTGVVFDASSQISISGNYIATHSDGGIDLVDSSNMTIWMNNLTGNGLFGIRITNSTDARIYHNNFIAHVDHALDDSGSENRWDDGYPSGGNYWDDYIGSDVYSGEDQNLPGRDGIGDIPYSLDMNTMDRYPLLVDNRSLIPMPPKNVTANLEGKDCENVTVSWSLSRDETNGSIVGYDVYRGTVYGSNGSDYLHVDSLANGTSSWTDVGSGEGDASNYFYFVCALNDFNLSSCARDQAAKFTRPLSLGPNLISIPLIPSDESIETVLQTVEYDKAWSYDPSSQEWKWYMPSKTYRRGLWSMSHTMGIWVNVTDDSNLTVAGIVPAQATIHLHKGWNLVSFPSLNTSYSVSDMKTEIGATRVEGYNPALPNFLRVLGGPDVLQAGFGYWVRVETVTDWMVEVS